MGLMIDPLQLLASLSLNSAPSTPIGGPSAPAAFSPRIASPASSPAAGTRTPKADLSRARSVRTERRREKFAKVLKGRQEEGSIEQSAYYRWASNSGEATCGSWEHVQLDDAFEWTVDVMLTSRRAEATSMVWYSRRSPAYRVAAAPGAYIPQIACIACLLMSIHGVTAPCSPKKAY
jgi:hypothetical protein